MGYYFNKKSINIFFVKVSSIVFLISISAMPVNAAKWYVDNSLGEVAAEEKIVLESPQAVQLKFEFQTNGEFNKRATKHVKPQAIEYLEKTGVFSEVTEDLVPNGAILKIVFNNIFSKEEIKKAKKDGFKSGLSFGLLGGVFTTDRYEVSFEYFSSNNAEPIIINVEHALHRKSGKKDIDVPGTRVKNVKVAISELTRQVMDRGANDIASKLTVSDQSGDLPENILEKDGINE